jgi:hypothetical protein
LKVLSLFECNFDDLPPEICGENKRENVLRNILRSNQYIDRNKQGGAVSLSKGGKRRDAKTVEGFPFSTHVQRHILPVFASRAGMRRALSARVSAGQAQVQRAIRTAL